MIYSYRASSLIEWNLVILMLLVIYHCVSNKFIFYSRHPIPLPIRAELERLPVMHPPNQQQTRPNTNDEGIVENALERWNLHRKMLHDSSCYIPQNGSITYVPSMVGATGHSQIEHFFKLYPASMHPISHPENRLISRSISPSPSGQDSVAIMEEILITFDHSIPIDYFLPNVPVTRRCTVIPVIFIVQYTGELIQNLRVYWDQLMLTTGLQIQPDLVMDKGGNAELLLKRTTKPSSRDFQAILEEREGQLLAQKAALMQRSQTNKRDLPISKRSSINEIVFSPTPPVATTSANEEQLTTLNQTLDSMCITPMRDRQDENKILGIGPSKYLSSNLFKTESVELEDNIKPPNLSLATPVHQSKIGRFSVSRSRIFGDSECDSEPQSPVTSKPPSLSINTAQRIWGTDLEGEADDVSGNVTATRQCSRNLQSKVFEQEGSPFLPSLKINTSRMTNRLEEEIKFIPSLGGTKAHDSLKESPVMESEPIIPAAPRKNLVSHISLGTDDTDEPIQPIADRPAGMKNRSISQIPFGSDE